MWRGGASGISYRRPSTRFLPRNSLRSSREIFVTVTDPVFVNVASTVASSLKNPKDEEETEVR
jgi:hypothetical protein